MWLQRRAAAFLQRYIMEFTLTIDFGFGEQVKFSTDALWKAVAVAGFVERLEEFDDQDEAEDEFADEEYVYDEEGVAYWFDEENEVWYAYDEESDDWYECEEVAEDGAEEEEVAA